MPFNDFPSLPRSTFKVGTKVLFKSPEERRGSYSSYENRICTVLGTVTHPLGFLVRISVDQTPFIDGVWPWRLHPIKPNIKITIRRKQSKGE